MNNDPIEIGKSFAPHPAPFRDLKKGALRQAIEHHVDSLEGTYELDGIDGTAVVNHSTAGKIASGPNTPEQADAAFNLAHILNSAEHVENRDDRRGSADIAQIHVLRSTMDYGGKKVPVKVTVKQYPEASKRMKGQRHKVYHVEAFEMGEA
jgi:hypothetical protein